MQSDVIMLQEVHGLPGEAIRQLRAHDKQFHMEESPGTGGLLTMIRRTLIHATGDQGAEHITAEEKNSTVTTHNDFEEDLEKNGGEVGADSVVPGFTPHELIPGRALCVTLHNGPHDIHLVNIHNHGLSFDRITHIEKFLEKHNSNVSVRGGSQTTWLAGDWNCLAGDEVPLRIKDLAQDPVQPQDQQRHLRAKRWNKIFEKFVEFHSPEAVSRFDSTNSSFSRLDRIYTNIDRWALPLAAPDTVIFEAPDILHARLISDHSPVGIVLGKGVSKPKHMQAISPHIFTHPKFQEFYVGLVKAAQLDTLRCPLVRAESHKEILRHAADLTFKVIRSSPAECKRPEFGDLIFTIAARAVWNKHTKTISNILQQHAHMRKYLGINDGEITWHDRTGFAQAHALAKATSFKYKQECLEANSSTSCTALAHNNRQATHMQRNAKLWAPLGGRMSLTAVRLGDEIISNPQDVAAALGQGWAKTFAVAPVIDEHRAKVYLDEYAVPLDFTSCTVPSRESIAHMINKMSHSAPGPDGLPYAAWKAGGIHSAHTIHGLLLRNLAGGRMPASWNDSLTVYLPKGEEAGDTTNSVVRAVNDTRPLALKNSDNKLVCSSINHVTKPVLTRSISGLQRGFVAKRQLLQNVLELDTYAHIHAMSSSPLHMPLLVFFDFAAAFPSVSHQWLFLTLTALQFPTGIIALVKNMYTCNSALYFNGTETICLFHIVTGVLQGCPLSGLLFAACMDPFLRHIEKVTSGNTSIATPQFAYAPHFMAHTHIPKCIVRACADDVGASMSSIFCLLSLHICYNEMQHVSGLRLKPKKCVIIPLAEKFHTALIALYRSWLAIHIPEWEHFSIVPHGKYLGFMLGPDAGTAQWEGPKNKYKDRVNKLAVAHMPTSLACHMYNSHALSVLQFVAQVLLLPKGFNQVEMGLLHKLLHLPNNAFPLKALHGFPLIGGPALSSSLRSCTSARIRASVTTLTSWEPLLTLLKVVSELFLETARHMQGHHFPVHFDRPPFILYVQAAKSGSLDIGHSSDMQVKPCKSLQVELQRAAAAHQLPHLQTKVSKLLASTAFSIEDWSSLLDERLRDVLTVEECLLLHEVQWHDVFKLWRTLGVHHAMQLIKTVSGQWCTSRRFSSVESPLKCIVGCDAPDDWQHYSHCSKLWSLANNITKTDSGRHPLARLGLHPICLGAMCRVLITCTVYHEIKLGYKSNMQEFNYPRIKQAAELAHKSLQWNSRAHAREAFERLRNSGRCVRWPVAPALS